ncbi:MAG: DegT/DnrJ/EryC1/StrS family aminotransferase [Chitinophagales bacterium]
MINVTQTFLPDIEEYFKILSRAWDKKWVTNNGELVQELEYKLKKTLDVKHLFYTNNGTIVLQMALKALNLTKEIITTPFSYVATTNVILWENCTPVFADIEPHTFCINPVDIEKKITSDTQAILATHVFGYPCNVDKIEEIAQKYNLKVIYDGAHAFACNYKNKSLLNYGDISTCSFHATKLFHTIEGGCIITNDDEIAKKLYLYRQFGHDYDNYLSVGINAKNSEFHAAMGLCILPKVQYIITEREKITELYISLIKNDHIQIPTKKIDALTYNYAYFPILFSSEVLLLKAKELLESNAIFSRRYFYPSLNTLPFLETSNTCLISEDISKRILCIPLHVGLSENDIRNISSILNEI